MSETPHDDDVDLDENDSGFDDPEELDLEELSDDDFDDAA